ncbi:hypothetical protein, conserved [Babesia ovata]|uniref:Uncharacterized protein n=1 Tax=Babesia ovata TaxID=189622 RepID=A0A2H6K6J2_9APIC|nr:uncharacterized protein BOVATA_001100 [Babesia ovata]GBE58617.1 hypothetical protein, conserved [Babesia ovata]
MQLSRLGAVWEWAAWPARASPVRNLNVRVRSRQISLSPASANSSDSRSEFISTRRPTNRIKASGYQSCAFDSQCGNFASAHCRASADENSRNTGRQREILRSDAVEVVSLLHPWSHPLPGPRGHAYQMQRRRVATGRDDGPGTEWRRRVIGCQPLQNLKVGPYKRGKWFVSYKEDPGSFITNILILLVTGYSIFTMLPGESMSVRRQRKMRQLLLDNAQMTEADLAYIENYRLPEEDDSS